MSLEERLEKAEKLVAEVKAELAAMRATKRNWPERIEAGMCFRHEPTQMVVLWTHERMEDCVVLARGGGIGDAIKKEYLRVYRNCEYLGHARDIITIRTDAHEPTGAELVGKVCQFTNGAGSAVGPVMMCIGYDGSGHGPYSYQAETGSWFIGARLAK